MRSALSRWRCRPWIAALAVGVVAAWNSQAVLTFDFVAFDDDINIVFNPHLGPPRWEQLQWMFSDSDYMRRYVPLGWLSFALVYAWSGLQAAGYHAANWLLHAINATLVFALLLRIIRRYCAACQPSWQVGAAALGAAVWALHPMRAETVGWASGLLYGVSGCFALGSVLAYFYAVETARSRGRMALLSLSAALYAGSVFSYPMSVGLLAVFILVDLADRVRALPAMDIRRLLGEKLILALPGVAAAVLALLANRHASDFWTAANDEFASRGMQHALLQAFDVWRYYLLKPWWPVLLTPAPTWLQEMQTHVLAGAWSVLLILGGTAGLFLRPPWRRGPLLLWLAHLALLAPMLGLTENRHFVADRYHYLPAVVMAAGVAILLLQFGGRLRLVAAVGGLAAIAALAVAQRDQLQIWRNTDTLLHRAALASHDPAFLSQTYDRWVRFHLDRGDPAAAESVIRDASARQRPFVLDAARRTVMTRMAADVVPREPLITTLHQKLALDFARGARPVEAAAHFRAMMAHGAREPATVFNYAMFLALHERPDEAAHLYLHYIATAPGKVSPEAQGRLLARIADGFRAQRRIDLAARVIDRALRELAQDGGAEARVLEASLNGQRANAEKAVGNTLATPKP